MHIAVVGSGNIGATSARVLTRAGHRVTLANSRGPESLRDLVAELGEQASAGTVEEAARDAEVVLVAIPFGRFESLPAAAFAGQVVIDATNYYAPRDGHLAAIDDGATTSSELLAAHLAGARVVKAFNTVYFVRLGKEGRPPGAPGRLAVPIAGDDAEAKAIVTGLVDDMGFDAVDNGGLAEGGARQQPGTSVYNKPLTAEELRAALGRS
jgi:8-hydroxy-5-deazaflavin:NADPH oxidoreductase